MDNSIAIDNQYKTSIDGIFAGGDVTTGETLVVKAMSPGREAAQSARIPDALRGKTLPIMKHITNRTSIIGCWRPVTLDLRPNNKHVQAH